MKIGGRCVLLGIYIQPVLHCYLAIRRYILKVNVSSIDLSSLATATPVVIQIHISSLTVDATIAQYIIF